MVGQVSWVQNEFGENAIKDARLRIRLVTIANEIFKRPGSQISSTQEGNAKRKAAYKFFSNAKTETRLIQSPHVEQTTKRCKNEKEVLVIQDTTYLYFGKRDTLEEGYIGTNQSGKIKGLIVHSGLCINGGDLPLGLIYQKIYTHKEKNSRVNHKTLPIEEKESYRWIEVVEEAVRHIGADKVVVIGDRESDIFELLHRCDELKCKLIVRQSFDRKVLTDTGKSKISDVLSGKEIERFVTDILVYSAEKKGYRTRRFEISYAPVTVDVPLKNARAFKEELAPVNYSVVQAKSIDGGKEIKWILLTNISVKDNESALDIMNYYKKRWHIENYHKALKSGFKAEDARLESYEGLEKLVAILGILAVRLYYILHLFKNCGEESCNQILDDREREALCIKFKRSPSSLTINDAVRMIAQLGGYMNRKSDGPPGIITLWRGWRRFIDISSFYKTMVSLPPKLQLKLKGNR